jgi:hypothetical protein
MKTKNIISALFATAVTSGLFAQGITLQNEVHHPVCNGDNNGAIYVTPIGGVAPYTYIWSTADDTYAAKDLMAGEYSVTVVDAEGNSVSETITLNEPEYVAINGTITKVTNFGGHDGAIDVSVTGLTPEYTIKWSSNHGTGLVAEQQLDQNGLSAGVYTMTVTTNNVCVKSRNFLVTQKMPRLVDRDMLNNITSSGGFGHMPLVYPNPSNGEVNFRNVEATDLIEIYNQFGTRIQAVNAMEGTNLPVGNYNVVITHADGNREVETLVVR